MATHKKNTQAHEEKIARLRESLRGLPVFSYRYLRALSSCKATYSSKRGYGLLTKDFKIHYETYDSFLVRPDEVGGSDYSRSVEDFIRFILDIGPIPEGMVRPSIGRIDHSKGYFTGNFEWQEFAENNREQGLRNNPLRTRDGLGRYKPVLKVVGK